MTMYGDGAETVECVACVEVCSDAVWLSTRRTGLIVPRLCRLRWLDHWHSSLVLDALVFVSRALRLRFFLLLHVVVAAVVVSITGPCILVLALWLIVAALVLLVYPRHSMGFSEEADETGLALRQEVARAHDPWALPSRVSHEGAGIWESS